MKKIGEKITYGQTPEKLLINISGRGTRQQILLLTLWLVLWTIAGTVIISQVFSDYPREQKMYLIIWLVFWIYLEYKVYFNLRWRKGGLEIIKVEGGRMSYSREVNGAGKVKSFDTEQVRSLQVIDYSDKPFQKSFYKSYWSVGGEMLSFTYLGREISMAMQIEEGDARQLKRLIDKALESAKPAETPDN